MARDRQIKTRSSIGDKSEDAGWQQTGAANQPANSQSLVRVNPEDKEVLKLLSAEEGESMAAIIHKALRAYKRQLFFRDLNSAYERLRQGDDAWQTELTERQQWCDVISESEIQDE